MDLSRTCALSYCHIFGKISHCMIRWLNMSFHEKTTWPGPTDQLALGLIRVTVKTVMSVMTIHQALGSFS